jgi:putative DNA primase/helicase
MTERNLDTLERATGRWHQILPHFGVPQSALTKRNGPCPNCGGKDRFRFTDKEGSGSYICNQCGHGGSGILLIRKMRDWTHKQACDAIDEIIGTDAPPPEVVARYHELPRTDDEKNRRRIYRALEEANDTGIADLYLKKRGLSVTSSLIRGQHHCPYYEEVIRTPEEIAAKPNAKKRFKLVGKFKAMVVPVAGADGSLQSVHRVYDADLGTDEKGEPRPRKKTLPPVTTIKGGAVRLFECDEELAIAEGIETSLAVHELFGVPVWSCLTANGIESFEPPKGLLRLQIYGDNDATMTGQMAAYALAKRALRADIAVEVHIPPQVGRDWLDVLNEQKGVAA